MTIDKSRLEEIISCALTKHIPDSRRSELADLLELLMLHKTVDDENSEIVAKVIAVSSLGNNHLWQDMELHDRSELSELIETFFKPLYDKNYKDMKWKKFFYRQICGWEGFSSCRSPSCEDCIDYDECFGPED